MHLPQWIYLAIALMGLLTSARDHGRPRTDQNFWTSLAATALALGLLYWGGFFSH
jgi:hypothetical protein